MKRIFHILIAVTRNIKTSGMWRHAVWYKFTNVSEELNASSTLKVGVVGTSETLINFYKTACSHIPEDGNLLKWRDHLEDLSADGRIILKLILMKLGEKAWTGFIWLRTEISGEIVGTFSGSINRGE
jgi:hypothetical protein